MPQARKSLVTSAEGEAEANRLRALLEGTFPTLATLSAAKHALAPEPERAEAEPGTVAAAPDWSVTLANIGAMSARLREHGEQLAAAEARAARAEARAEEAETWLRRLHQAVLDGLPVARRA